MKSYDGLKKVWVCLFTCLSTRAMHLEVTDNLTTWGFLNAFRKFVARRNCPITIFSDQAKIFQLASSTIELAWSKIIQDPEAFKYYTSQKITWKFNVPLAPWSGGYYERMVGLVKQSYRKVIGRQSISMDNFTVLITEIETVVNSRPITFIYNEVGYQPLRHIAFLQPHGTNGIPVFSEELDSDDDSDTYTPEGTDNRDRLLAKWLQTTKKFDHFWKIWIEEYLTSLRERYRDTHHSPRSQSYSTPKVGEVVILKEDHIPRGHWKMAKIVEVKDSKDHEIRSATFELPNKKRLIRSVNYLYPLEISTSPDKTIESRKGKDSIDCSPIASRTRSKTVNEPSIVPKIFYIALLMVCRYADAKINQCSKHIEYNSLVYFPNCTTRGILVYNDREKYCWKNFDCGFKHIRIINEKATCGKACTCPDWSTGCSFYNGRYVNDSNNSSNIYREIFSIEKIENICSTEPRRDCDIEPRFGYFLQIMLFDNSTHLISKLNIVHSEITEGDYQCIGEGNITGTSVFCKYNKCVPNGTRFCFFSQPAITYFQNEVGKIPVKAWGEIGLKYYPYRQTNEERDQCDPCSLKCIKSGIQFVISKNIEKIEICSKEACYEINNPKTEDDIIFPSSLTVTAYEVILTTWAKGLEVKKIKTKCTASPFCETIQCTFCWVLITNLQCASTLSKLLLILALTSFIFLVSFITMIVVPLLILSLRLLKFLIIISKNIIFDLIRKCTRKLFSRNIYECRDTVRKNPLSLKALKKPIVLLILIISIVGQGGSCPVITSLNAKESQCLKKKIGDLTCIFEETLMITLPAQNVKTCMLLRDFKNQSVGLLTFELLNIQAVCGAQIDYHSRSYRVKTESFKNCPRMGSCSEDKCKTISSNELLPEFLRKSKKYPGYTVCYESCGCWNCGCFFCSPGCLFGRLYAVPTTKTIYEAFSCQNWKTQAILNVTLTSDSRTVNHIFRLAPGHLHRYQDLRLTLVSLSLPPLPAANYRFLYSPDKESVAKVSLSEQGNPICGLVGSLQCSNYEKARNFDCKFPIDCCQCQAGETSLDCLCKEHSLEKLFRHSENLLPLSIGNYTIRNQKRNIYIDLKSSSSAQLQVSVSKLRVTVQAIDASYWLSNKTIIVSGCYMCPDGAKTHLTCTTSFGEVVAEVQCKSNTFFINCGSKGIDNEATLYFNQEIINEPCTLVCPRSNITYSLKGDLFIAEDNPLYIESKRIFNKQIQKDNSAINIEFPDLLSIYHGIFNWMKAKITVVITICCSAVVLYLVIYVCCACIYPRNLVQVSNHQKIV